MLIVTRSEVERLLPIDTCVGVLRRAMIAVSQGRSTLPIRQFLPIPDAPGKLAVMPGTLSEPHCFGIKLVAKYDRPYDDPLGTHVGMVLLFDSAAGVPLALIEGSSLTAIRTAAASALATDLLARSDATRLAIIGTGEQARRHVAAMHAVRPIQQVVVWGRDPTRAAAFAHALRAAGGPAVEVADNVASAVAGADIICTATSASEPVVFGHMLEPGQHLNLVGSAIPTTAEVDAAAVARARFYVDYRPAAMAAAGELLQAIAARAVNEDHIVAEIGEVAAGAMPGRRSTQEITIYKSLGVAAQDLAAAHAVWTAAGVANCGTRVDLLA